MNILSKKDTLCDEPECKNIFVLKVSSLCGDFTGSGCGLVFCKNHLYDQGAISLCAPCAINSKLTGDSSMKVLTYKSKNSYQPEQGKLSMRMLVVFWIIFSTPIVLAILFILFGEKSS